VHCQVRKVLQQAAGGIRQPGIGDNQPAQLWAGGEVFPVRATSYQDLVACAGRWLTGSEEDTGGAIVLEKVKSLKVGRVEEVDGEGRHG